MMMTENKENAIFSRGDVILLAFGGHGFEIVEESEIIEIKTKSICWRNGQNKI